MHEIQNLTHLIQSLVPPTKELIVDFGSGLGYLSEMLVETSNYQILGLEGDAQKVESAQRRLQHFEKKDQINYVQHFITSESKEFIEEQINSTDTDSAAIVGLHSCGDLTITAIELFHQITAVRRLIIMSCCYHRQLKNETENNRFKNLPLSNAFKEALSLVPGSEDMINVAFARLACQHSAVIWRTITEEQHKRHGETMFDRALIELVPLEGEHLKRNPNTRTLDAVTFEAAKQRYRLVNGAGEDLLWLPIHQQRYEILLEKYRNGSQLSSYLKCLQNCIQGLCEHVIMMDRYAYILEYLKRTGTTVKNLEYRKITNDEISPRGFALIVEK